MRVVNKLQLFIIPTTARQSRQLQPTEPNVPRGLFYLPPCFACVPAVPFACPNWILPVHVKNREKGEETTPFSLCGRTAEIHGKLITGDCYFFHFVRH